ncbi:MAG: hypothetical protein V4475_18475 [Pseudomonadota bacterium]
MAMRMAGRGSRLDGVDEAAFTQSMAELPQPRCGLRRVFFGAAASGVARPGKRAEIPCQSQPGREFGRELRFFPPGAGAVADLPPALTCSGPGAGGQVADFAGMLGRTGESDFFDLLSWNGGAINARDISVMQSILLFQQNRWKQVAEQVEQVTGKSAGAKARCRARGGSVRGRRAWRIFPPDSQSAGG